MNTVMKETAAVEKVSSVPGIKAWCMQQLKRPATAWWILAILLVVTAVVWLYAEHLVSKRTQDRFQFRTSEIHDAIAKRLQDQEDILRGGVGLFAASINVDRFEWKAYAQALNLEKNYPGLQGFGYSMVIRPADRDTHINTVRAEGFPFYQIRPDGRRELYTSIVYLEPFSGRNLRAFGYDMFSEPVRREAMERARDSGEVAMSGKVRLVQETEQDVQHGFLMYLPVYRNGRDTATTAQRRSALQGYVYSPFRMNDLMRGILDERSSDLDFTIYDGPTISNEAFLYNSASQTHLTADHGHKLERTSVLEFGGRQWLLSFRAHDDFVPMTERAQPLVLAAGGVLIDLLMFVIFYTIARRRQQAEALAITMTENVRAGAARMHAIVENVIDGIITIDENGTVESLNAAAVRIFDYPAAEVIGKNVSMLMPEPYRSRHDGYLARYLAGGAPRIIGSGREVEGQRKDGSTFPMDLAVSALQLSGRRLFIGIVRDITERKKAERLKSEFISTVSHELRTPLTSIRGSLGLIAGGVAGVLPDKARELAEIAYKNSERLSRLINDILDIEKIESGRMQFVLHPQAMTTLIDQSIAAYRGYGEQYQVRFVVTGEIPDVQVEVDTERFMQVMANLLSNAAKFSPAGAAVDISVTTDSERVRVAVTDRGPGIPDEFRDRIFQKFSQADSSDTRSKGGSGLGLSIARSIIERMGGSIGYRSAAEHGTTFHIDLPVLARKATEMPPTTASCDNGPRILVCEDEPDVARVIAATLAQAGLQTDIAYNAAEARAALQARAYDAMTLDLMLPGEDGISLIRSLRSEPGTRHVPIVVVSAKADDGRARINGGFGVIDWLGKPFDPEQLRNSVDRAIHSFAGFRVRVLHVEDDPDVRKVVASLAGNLADFDHAATLAEAQAKLQLEQYGLVILDISLPDGSGWELLRSIERFDQPPPVMVLSGTTVAAEQARQVASALVKASSSNDDIVKTIRALLRR